MTIETKPLCLVSLHRFPRVYFSPTPLTGRVTITRVLHDLEARDWIDSSGQAYGVTSPGEWVCEEFARFVAEMEAEQRLRTALQWFPSDLLTFDVRCLRDAEVFYVDRSDLTAFQRRVMEFHRSGERIRGLTRGHAPEALENLWELTVRGDTQLELVFAPEVVAVIRDHPPSVRHIREMIQEDSVDLFVHGDIPNSLGIVNGSVGINLVDEAGVPKGGLVSSNEVVLDWAVALFETYKGTATPVEVDSFRD